MSTQQSDLHVLVQQLEQKDKLITAQKTRIEFLEHRLAERMEQTIQDYSTLRLRLDKMQNLVYQIFLGLPANTGLTRAELQEEFERQYPSIHSADSGRRAYELVEQGKLWKETVNNRTTFYLKLSGGETE